MRLDLDRLLVARPTLTLEEVRRILDRYRLTATDTADPTPEIPRPTALTPTISTGVDRGNRLN